MSAAVGAGAETGAPSPWMEKVNRVVASGETTLNLWGNNIGAKGCAHLATVLQSAHCAVTTLDLSWNEMGAEGCAHLATALQIAHCTVTTLNLHGNNIGDEGCAHLATALQSAPRPTQRVR